MSVGVGQGGPVPLRIFLRWNALAYAAVSGILIVTNIYTGGGWWSFWPLFIWGVALALHFLYVNSIGVDDDWVAERAEELRYRSYDQGHIHDIEKRVDDHDPSVRPADERE